MNRKLIGGGVAVVLLAAGAWAMLGGGEEPQNTRSQSNRNPSSVGQDDPIDTAPAERGEARNTYTEDDRLASPADDGGDESEDLTLDGDNDTKKKKPTRRRTPRRPTQIEEEKEHNDDFTDADKKKPRNRF